MNADFQSLFKASKYAGIWGWIEQTAISGGWGGLAAHHPRCLQGQPGIDSCVLVESQG